MIKDILNLLFITGKTDEPVRLQKRQSKTDYLENVNDFIARNFYLIALIMMVVCMILFIFVCFAIVGVSATESGMQYNQLQNII